MLMIFFLFYFAYLNFFSAPEGYILFNIYLQVTMCMNVILALTQAVEMIKPAGKIGK